MVTPTLRRAPIRTPLRLWGKRFAAMVALAIAIVGGYFAYRIQSGHEETLRALGEFLWVRESLEPADIIYVLGGDYERRIPHAARLYKQGLAPRVVIPREDERGFQDRENFSDISKRMLVEAGVPDSAIHDWKVGYGVATTIDELRALRLYADTLAGVRSVIIVTSAYHTRRVSYTSARVMPSNIKIQVDGEEYREWQLKNWWLHPAGYSLVRQEYLKLVYYWFCYALG